MPFGVSSQQYDRVGTGDSTASTGLPFDFFGSPYDSLSSLDLLLPWHSFHCTFALSSLALSLSNSRHFGPLTYVLRLRNGNLRLTLAT